MALMVMVRVPVRVPRALGVNVTLTVHFAPTASDVPQVLVWGVVSGCGNGRNSERYSLPVLDRNSFRAKLAVEIA